MDKLQLYKFLTEYNIEYRGALNCGEEDILIFVNISDIEDFYNLFSSSIFDDDGLSCTMKDGYFVFWMNDICEYYGIEVDEVFQTIKK